MSRFVSLFDPQSGNRSDGWGRTGTPERKERIVEISMFIDVNRCN